MSLHELGLKFYILRDFDSSDRIYNMTIDRDIWFFGGFHGALSFYTPISPLIQLLVWLNMGIQEKREDFIYLLIKEIGITKRHTQKMNRKNNTHTL